jgi:cytoskeletal protein CcmA (bactofilin family)
VATIGPSIHVDGDIRGDEDLVIEGEVNGTINLRTHTLTIGEGAKVRAVVYARAAFISGFFDGDIYASERLAIRKGGRVRGDLVAPRVAIEDGGKFKGSIEMDRSARGMPQRPRSLDELEVVIDPGRATPEIVGRYLSELSVVYRMLGGSGIAFAPHSDPQPPIRAPVPAESALTEPIPAESAQTEVRARRALGG